MLLSLKLSNGIANSVDPDQTPQNAASDLGLHCLPMSLLRENATITKQSLPEAPKEEGTGHK